MQDARNRDFRDIWKGIVTQFSAIMLSALGAALFAFIGAIATQTGGCVDTNGVMETSSTMGALLKATHTILTAGRV